jgi:hypothetical protein
MPKYQEWFEMFAKIAIYVYRYRSNLEKRYLKTVTGLTHAKARCGVFGAIRQGSAVSKIAGCTKAQAPGGSGASPSGWGLDGRG